MDAQVILFQMNALPNFTGKDVKCIYWELGECKEAEGELKFVAPYDRVIVGNTMISFVGVNDAIEQISSDEGIIYSCLGARGYQGCYAYDPFALVGAQQALLGRSIKYEALNEAYKNAPQEMLANEIKGGRGFHK